MGGWDESGILGRNYGAGTFHDIFPPPSNPLAGAEPLLQPLTRFRSTDRCLQEHVPTLIEDLGKQRVQVPRGIACETATIPHVLHVG
jgi:hypothetical protein